MAAGIWTTKDGRKLKIMWMDSVHLVYSFNMQARTIVQNNPSAGTKLLRDTLKKDSGLWPEIKARGLDLWNGGTVAYKECTLCVPKSRESVNELAYMHAARDTEWKDVKIESIQEAAHRGMESAKRVVASAVALRLSI